jgi:hypothetical protein
VIIVGFVGNSFSGALKTIAIILGILVLGYLLIHAIPILIVAAIVIYVVMKIKKYINSKFAIKNANITNNLTEEAASKSFDDLQSDVIDVDYKDI